MPDSTSSPVPQSSGGAAPGDAAVKKPRRLRRVLYVTGMAGLAFLLVAGVGVGGAEYYTSRPDFCGSCHVMDPYFGSWSKDIHGSKVGVRCIDCHYAPGERMTIMAKFKGLSQVASYFSGRYGAGRPRAHVSDDSCLRSGCHGDRAFESKLIPIGQPRVETRMVGDRPTEVRRLPTVFFSHAKHLHVDEKLSETRGTADEAYAKLKASLPTAALERINGLALSVAPSPTRAEGLKKLVQELRLDETQAQHAQRLMELRHRETRLRQLAGLNCSACHTYNAQGESHIKVDRQVCFTCHFNNETFNEGTGACLKCHEPPSRAVFVHDRSNAKGDAAVLMDHQEIVQRGIDCASCHADVLRGHLPGSGGVSARDCKVCHDQDRFLEGFEARTIETVAQYHADHVAKQRAHCQDCHRTIEHGLLTTAPTAHESGFLRPVLDDCRHCHPNHHAAQVALLSGTGGNVIGQSTPNAMLGSRLNCRACHTDAAQDEKGDQLVGASQQACVACHSADYAEMFAQWKNELESYTSDSEAQLKRMEERLERRVASGLPTPGEVTDRVNRARENIRLVRLGNGVHNRHYSLQLLDAAWKDLQEASGLLGDR